MRLAAVAVLAGCGRVSFDPRTDASDTDPGDGSGSLASAASTISAGGQKTCALVDGDAYCWGHGTLGGLGDGSTNDRPTAGPVPAPVKFVAIESSDGGACAIVADGTGWCWGYNTWGQFGVGNTNVIDMPQQISPTDIAQIAIGYVGTCVRTQAGAVLCAGRGDMIGDGTNMESDQFKPVGGIDDAIDVTAGDQHVCVLRGAGGVACWGANDKGQLGDATFVTPRLLPTTGPIGPYIDLSAGDEFTCGLRASGGVDCWGSNDRGELGNNQFMPQPDPTTISGLDDAVSVTTGSEFGCAIRRTGELVCWGRGDEGALGDSTMADRTMPGPVPLADVVEVTTRTAGHACARTRDQAVWCWGKNEYGQIGNGNIGTNAFTPQRVMNLP